MKYMFYFIRVAICLCEVIKIPDEIYSLCPYTDICNKTAVETFVNLGISSEPCCAPCSCDDKCGLRMDCCFADMDKYKLVENGRAACLRPVDGIFTNDFMLNHYYFMVQSCGIEHLNSGSHSIVDKDCLHDEYGKPIIAPVSSIELGLVYVNAKCAECNDVVNYKIWNFYSNTVNLKKMNNLNVTETKIFIPPDNVFGMNKKVCFKDFEADTCLDNDPRLSLCRNLIAPYIYDRMIYYRNVFCAACSHTIDTHVCVKPVISEFTKKFSYLIDVTVTQMANKLSAMPQTVESLYDEDRCNESGVCHNILCPEGMVNTPDGCQYYIIKWKVDLFTVQLKLQPAKEAKLSEEMLYRLTISEQSDPISWIHIPCSNMVFTEIAVYNEINEKELKPVNSFVVQLGKKPIWIELPTTISSLRKCIDEQWSITVANSTYIMNASFDRYQSYIQDGHQRRQIIMHMDNETGNQEEEIELSTTEVRFNYGEISILSNNVTLGDNEFMVKTKVGADGKSYNVVAVCVEDFIHDLHRIYAASKGIHNMMGVMALVVVLQSIIMLIQISKATSDFLK